MLANNLYILLGIVCCLHQLNVNAYPTINIRRLFDSAIEGRYKKSDLNFPQPDEEVLELEHLKHDEPTSDDSSSEGGDIHFEITSAVQPATAAGDTPINPTDLLPDLEQQLEQVTTAKTSPINNVGQQEQEETSGIAPHHRPPTLPQNDGGKVTNNHQPAATNEETIPSASDTNANPPLLTKPFYGAARLAFGQNPEVLPSTSTTTTTTTTTTTMSTTTTLPSSTNENTPESIITSPPSAQSIETSAALPPSSDHNNQEQQQVAENNSNSGRLLSLTTTTNSNEKEQVDDTIVPHQLDATKPGPERRSVTMMPPKTAENLLKHKDGQYSSFDMAQYVFWTGDEAGVARTVEEFIEQGLMSRESAIKFLRDIRLGIEYLQNSYNNRVFPDQLRDNYIKKHSHNTHSTPVLPTVAAATTTTSTTRRPPPPPPAPASTVTPVATAVERAKVNVMKDYPVLNQHLEKTLESVPSVLRLQDVNNLHNRGTTEYDEAAGRAMIAKFLYTEFSLEDVIYQLGKVMFSQSLAHGSNQAQQALQRLTDFLEAEGRQGMISPELQKKVLDVLLSALSDTLVEHPELLAAARANLGSSFEKIPVQSVESVKN